MCDHGCDRFLMRCDRWPLRRNTTVKDTFCAAADYRSTFPLQNKPSKTMSLSSPIHLWQSSAAARVFISPYVSIRLRCPRRLASVLTYTESITYRWWSGWCTYTPAIAIDIETATNRLITADNRRSVRYHCDGRSASVSAALVVENMAVGYRWPAWW